MNGKCIVCAGVVSSDAKACPHCGHKMNDHARKIMWLKIGGGVAFAYGCLAIFGSLGIGAVFIIGGLLAFSYGRILEGQ